MGLFDKLFSKPAEQAAQEKVQGYFKLLNGYTPAFTTYSGSLYEYELTRAAIHAFAVHCSKLQPEMQGSAYATLGKRIQTRMNPFMDTSKFLYRVATILEVDNNAFIIPLMDATGTFITGYFPIRPSRSEVVEDKQGNPWLRYTFLNGRRAAIEFERVGIINKYQLSNDLFGENNNALDATMQLLSVNNQGIIEGVKASATIRFMARLANVFKSEDITKERDRFVAQNLNAENNSGVMMFDNKYADVKQIDSKPWVVDADQMKAIQANVFNYFGCNESILQNNFKEDDWGAYYEGKVEPFAIQLSLVMSNMTYTERELEQGNKLMFTANRLQYASNKTKLDIVTNLFDRGFLTHNQGREIFNMSPVPDGDKYYIRLEYGEKGKVPDKKEVDDPDDNQG